MPLPRAVFLPRSSCCLRGWLPFISICLALEHSTGTWGPQALIACSALIALAATEEDRAGNWCLLSHPPLATVRCLQTALLGNLVPLPVTRSQGMCQGLGGNGSSGAMKQNASCPQEKPGKSSCFFFFFFKFCYTMYFYCRSVFLPIYHPSMPLSSVAIHYVR